MKIVVLISGSGSNLQAFIDQAVAGNLPCEIACVISNKNNAGGLKKAENAGIATAIVAHTQYDSREAFDTDLSIVIDQYQPDLVVLAGFMRILTPSFVEKYLGRMMNIHPSLLPKYPGLNTHQRAIDAKDKKAGATVHFVTAELDGGPAIIQAEVDIDNAETAESLAAKILEKEHAIYPLAIRWFATNRLSLKRNKAILDNEELGIHGYPYQS